MAPRKQSQDQSDNTFFDKLFDELVKVRDGVSHLDKKVDLYAQKTSFELEQIRALDAQQNAILNEHQQRSNELKKDNELREQALRVEIDRIDTRVSALEEPVRWRQVASKKVLSIAGAITVLGGLAYTILKLFVF